VLSVLPESKTTISEAHDTLLRVVSIVLSANNSDSEKLLEIFSTTEDLAEEQIVKASALIENAGGREATLEEADEHLKRAIEFLNNADIRKETFCELEEIAHFVVNRDS